MGFVCNEASATTDLCFTEIKDNIHTSTVEFVLTRHVIGKRRATIYDPIKTDRLNMLPQEVPQAESI